MTPLHTTPNDREEIELLLPWYVTGQLEAAERARVEDFLARHPEMRRQIDLIAEERAAAIALNEALAPPQRRPSVPVGTTTAHAARSPRPAKAGGWLAHVAQGVRDFFTAPTPGAVRWAAAAAALILGLQTVTITSLWLREPAPYSLASQGSPVQPAAEVLVVFKPAASAAEISDLLDANRARLVDGPLPGGLYRVRAIESQPDPTHRARHAVELARRLSERSSVVSSALAQRQ